MELPRTQAHGWQDRAQFLWWDQTGGWDPIQREWVQGKDLGYRCNPGRLPAMWTQVGLGRSPDVWSSAGICAVVAPRDTGDKRVTVPFTWRPSSTVRPGLLGSGPGEHRLGGEEPGRVGWVESHRLDWDRNSPPERACVTQAGVSTACRSLLPTAGPLSLDK